MVSDNLTGQAGAPFQAYLAAYLQGRETAKRRRREAALSALAPSAEAPLTGRATPPEAPSLHMPVHDILNRLPPEVQKAARDHADILFAFIQGVAHYPYADRARIIRHSAPHLMRLGFTADELTGFDPTDQNLAEIAGAARHVLEGDPRSARQTTPPSDEGGHVDSSGAARC
jgi:hypothetical protein